MDLASATAGHGLDRIMANPGFWAIVLGSDGRTADPVRRCGFRLFSSSNPVSVDTIQRVGMRSEVIDDSIGSRAALGDAVSSMSSVCIRKRATAWGSIDLES